MNLGDKAARVRVNTGGGGGTGGYYTYTAAPTEEEDREGETEVPAASYSSSTSDSSSPKTSPPSSPASSRGSFSGGGGIFSAAPGGGGGGGSTSTQEDKPKKQTGGGTPTPASTPAETPPTPSFSSLRVKIETVEEKIEAVRNQPIERVSTAEIEETLRQVEEISQQIEQAEESSEKAENPTSDSPSPAEEKHQLQVQTSQMAFNLKMELIKRLPDEQIAQACQLAREAIIQYAQQLNLTDFKFDQSELAGLTTSQAVTQHIQAKAEQMIRQQKLQQARTGEPPVPTEKP